MRSKGVKKEGVREEGVKCGGQVWGCLCLLPSLQGVIPSATLVEQRGRELRYLLPLHQSRPSVLARLFKQLELQEGVLGVSSYGLTTCSMEEVRERGREGGEGVVEKEEGRDITNVRDVTLLQIFVQLTEEEAQKQAEGKSTL